MRNWLTIIAALLGLCAPPSGQAAETPQRVFVIPIRSEIEPPLVYIVRRGVKEAMEAKADLLVVDMNTPGGRVDVTEEIIKILGNFKGQSATFVNSHAFSAGAFISVATQKIYMAPGGVIGAAAPIMLSPSGGVQDVPSVMDVKMTSAVRGIARATADKNGYNLDVVEAMIDKNKELIIDGKTLKPKGDLLTLTDREAAVMYGDPPKPLLSSGTVESLEAMLDKMGFAGAQVTYCQPTGAEQFGTWINAISPILLIIGIIGIYIEVKTPGVIIPALVAGIAFLLYFFGGYVAGLSGMEWVVVFVIGLGLLLSEFFVHPGTVLPGLAGITLILIALVMAMVDMYPGTPALPTLPQIRLPLERLTLAALGSILIMVLLARVLPKTPVYRTLVSQGASGEASLAQAEQARASLIGQNGVALSDLRPGGKVRINEEILDAITEGELISKGQTVRITGGSGSSVVVEAA